MNLLMTYYHAGTGSASDIGYLVFTLMLLLVVVYFIHRFFRYLKNLPFQAEEGDDFDRIIKNN